MRGFAAVLVTAVVVGSVWWVGSVVAASTAPLGASAPGIALAAGLALCLVIPLILSRRIVRALADRTPRRASIHGATLLLVNGGLLAAALGGAPHLVRDGVLTAGDWPLFGYDVPVLSEALAAAHIGHRSEPTEAAPDDLASLDEPAQSLPPEPPPPADPLDAAGVFAAAADSVVVVEMASPAEGPIAEFMPTLRGHGSGFAVGADLVVSNFHVAGDATQLAVRTRDGQRLAARRLASLPTDDLVLLQVIDAALPPLELADDSVEIGDETWAIGAPLGLEYSLTEGIISGRRDMSGTPFLQMQTTVAPGSSGGPLLDDRARVVGVNTAVASPGLSLAVTVARVDALLALERDLEAAPLPLLAEPITLVRADLPPDLLPTERQQLESLLETVTAALSSVVRLDEPEGVLDLAPRDCRASGLSVDCDRIREELGFTTQILRFLPADAIEAEFTDVPRTGDGSGGLTLRLHKGDLPVE